MTYVTICIVRDEAQVLYYSEYVFIYGKVNTHVFT